MKESRVGSAPCRDAGTDRLHLKEAGNALPSPEFPGRAIGLMA